jgi:undecaprenyl-diphosphatase
LTARAPLELPLRHVLVLGLLHGPTELLPISSSAHTTLVPWIAGWPYARLDPAQRKSVEVALHAGTAVALLWRPPAVRLRGRASLIAAAIPPALAGYGLGAQIERRLGTPATIALGLLAGSAAMAAGELHTRNGRPPRTRGGAAFAIPTHRPRDAAERPAASAGVRDGFALGLAQALALAPGVSRSGATVAAARLRGFSRAGADRLSWSAGLPVIAGAAALKGSRLARDGAPPGLRPALAVGAASAFASTLASSAALTPARRARLTGACVAYRTVLALQVIRRMRDNTTRTPHIPKTPPAAGGILRR